ncbi:ATP/GTP-binding protein [Micromonospora orduensis]|uniref:ATP/GTP-binding protein n=1 Tax=Micromonospora orduensis TaxID=1420891 RepID=A0A5C4QRC4_9ACTN|nr:ATP/GTP-binding protein [Micromonospora orduensis]TNH27797.1 ATP/GTP-binding protein [Micromonospora orduensis]
MQPRAFEQHIAVFGESGSGKTVLLSSFYGGTQEPKYLKRSLFHVLAEDIGQGNRLHKNYLGMKDEGTLPLTTRFAATSYAFKVQMKDGSDPAAAKSRPFDVLRVVWHDYPGEWFEQSVQSPEEAQRRADTFRSLLSSDVALLLVDGQRLLDNAGEEDRYLKSLFGNLRNGVLSLRDELLEDGKPLAQFPRIWVMALSKADLLPDMDVYRFRDLLVAKACEDLEQLREAIAGLVEGREALSVGEDFVLLSSAKFEPGRISVAERVGLDLVLPLAAVLPFERHHRWHELTQLPTRLFEGLLGRADDLALALLAKTKLPGPLGLLMNLVGPDLISNAAKLAGDKLRAVNAEALSKKEFLSATLTGFRIDLEKGEENQILLRSVR